MKHPLRFARFLLVALFFLSGAVFAAPADLENLKERAQAGSDKAAYRYAMALWKDGGVKNAPNKEALYWLKRAAQQGYADATLTLAEIYEKKIVPPPSDKAAQELYELAHKRLVIAVEAGDGNAAAKLGQMYHDGQGVPQSTEEALKWFTRGVQLGSRRAKLLVGRSAVWGTTPGYTKQDALDILYEAANEGLSSAWMEIGYAYAGAFGGKVNHVRSLDAFKKAADAGNDEALRMVGIGYLSGLGTPKDPVLGLEYLRKSADLGNAEAMFNLALAYKMGIGAVSSRQGYLDWLRKAADKKLPDAHYHLGIAYRDGDGVAKNIDKALEYFHFAGIKKLVPAITAYMAITGKKPKKIVTEQSAPIASHE